MGRWYAFFERIISTMSFFQRVWSLRRYSFMLEQLVKRDFKVRYRGSVLGVLWSVLNPLLNMIVMSIVFSQVFRGIENYKMYLLAGITIYNYFSEATNRACMCMVESFGMITKVYFPKLVIPTARMLNSFINLLITSSVYVLIGLVTGLKLWVGYLLIPYVLICVLLFTMGMGYIISALFVFFRDTSNLYSVLLTIWMYATPIIYPIEVLPAWALPIVRINPLYIFIDFFRNVTMYATLPTGQSFLLCAVWGIGMFLAGVSFFVYNQKKFIYYL